MKKQLLELVQELNETNVERKFYDKAETLFNQEYEPSMVHTTLEKNILTINPYEYSVYATEELIEKAETMSNEQWITFSSNQLPLKIDINNLKSTNQDSLEQEIADLMINHYTQDFLDINNELTYYDSLELETE